MAGHAWEHPTKSSILRCYLFLVNVFMQKIKCIYAFLLEILMTMYLVMALDNSILAYNFEEGLAQTLVKKRKILEKRNLKFLYFRLLPARSNGKTLIKMASNDKILVNKNFPGKILSATYFFF